MLLESTEVAPGISPEVAPKIYSAEVLKSQSRAPEIFLVGTSVISEVAPGISPTFASRPPGELLEFLQESSWNLSRR